MSVHSTDAFRHATELVGTEIWSFCQHAQFYFAERRGLSWFSCWKSHHENAEGNSTAYERLRRAVYRFFARLRTGFLKLFETYPPLTMPTKFAPTPLQNQQILYMTTIYLHLTYINEKGVAAFWKSNVSSRFCSRYCTSQIGFTVKFVPNFYLYIHDHECRKTLSPR